jgi:hypothetical protein
VGGSYPYFGLGPFHLPGQLLSLRSDDEVQGFVVTPLAVVTMFFIFGFVGKESDTPNEGSGEGQACRSFSEASCVVSLFRSSVRQEILINWVRAELSVLARVSYGVVRHEFVGRPHLCPGFVRTEVVGAGHPGESGESAARGGWLPID